MSQWEREHLSELKFDAVTMTSSLFWTRTGIFLHPGDFSSLCRSFRVSGERPGGKAYDTAQPLNSTFNKITHYGSVALRCLPCRMLAGHISILVTTTNTGTFRASAKPRCSLVMPTIPALLPT